MSVMRTAHILLVLMTELALASPAAAETTEVPPPTPESVELGPAAPETGAVQPAAVQTVELPAAPAPATDELQPADGAPETAGAVAPAPQPTPESEATPPPPVIASETRQVIWQTQVGCVARCASTSQAQQASQVSSTSQSGVGQQVSDTQQMVRQTQVGCPAVCLEGDADVQAVYVAVLAAIRHDLPPGPLGERLMEDVMSLLGAALSADAAGPTATQEESAHHLLDDAGVAVAQAIEQIQVGCVVRCRETWQEQHASQDTLTSQAAGGFASVLQFIWQLQIGCIAFCEDTVQIQEAAQESHVIQGEQPEAPPEPGPEPQPGPVNPPVPPEAPAAPAAPIAPPTAPQSPPVTPPAEPRSSGGRRQPGGRPATPPRFAPRRPRRPLALRHTQCKGAGALAPAAPLVARPRARLVSTSSARVKSTDLGGDGAALPLLPLIDLPSDGVTLPLLPLGELSRDGGPGVPADLVALLVFALIGGAAAVGVAAGGGGRA
jgi:outer membrane biosynthesis protein TonB